MPTNIRLKVSTPPPIKLRYIEAVTKPEVEKTVTPTYEGVEVTPPSGATLSKVTVEPIPDPTDVLDISANDDYDVRRIGTVRVRVPQGIFPSGAKRIDIGSNGVFTHDVTNYESAEIHVDTTPAKGFIFEDYDSEGYPHSARFVGTWTEIPVGYLQWVFNADNGSLVSRINTVTIPEGVTTIGVNAFYNFHRSIVLPSTLRVIGGSSFYSYRGDAITLPHGLTTIGGMAFQGSQLEELIIPSTVTTIGGDAFVAMSNLKRVVYEGQATGIYFRSCTKCEFFDFSHSTTIPPLNNVRSMDHKSGAVVSIPSFLSDTTLGVGNGWESSNIWRDLTDLVWEVAA